MLNVIVLAAPNDGERRSGGPLTKKPTSSFSTLGQIAERVTAKVLPSRRAEKDGKLKLNPVSFALSLVD
jgi:hypothetical protein